MKALLDNESEERKDQIEEAGKYLLKNMKAAWVMEKEVQIGCAMEQAICHVYASSFTSVPKAYGESHLPAYVDARIHQQNGVNMERIHLNAVQQLVSHAAVQRAGGRYLSALPEITGFHADIERPSMEIGSMFDTKADSETYPVHLPYGGAYTVYWKK